jgi:hypothetical protein
MRVSRPDALSHEVAAGLIRTWLRFPVQDVTMSDGREIAGVSITNPFR